jgi:hypothetical protein
MDDLLREAIADAKAVRETALANAKIALEEAFTPRLQSMLSKKIQSEMEDADETEDAEERGMDEEDAEELMDKDEMDAEEMMDKDEMGHEEGEHEEGEHEEGEHEEGEHEEGEHDAEEMMAKDEEDAEEMMDKDEEEMDESEDKDEMEDKDEKEMDEMEDKDEDEKMDEMEDKDEEDKDELDLESVLAELEKDLEDEDSMDEEYNTDEVGDGMNKDEVETDEDKLAENDVSSETGKADNKVNAAANDSSKIGQGPESEGSDKKAGDELGDHETVDDLVEMEDKDEEDKEEGDLDLDEVLRALTEEDKDEQDAEENEKLKSEIKEHRKVINFMRKQLNEVNLMNAKLLFSNKLFRAFGLNNNQKLKVVENFDRTTNLREVKLVYATLAESFKKPSRISESVKKGSSSKPTRSTKPVKEVLSEGAELKARFKKLANIL